MSTLAELHANVPPGPIFVVALGLNGPWELQTSKVRLATCRNRMVADYLAALWNAHVEPESRKSGKPARVAP